MKKSLFLSVMMLGLLVSCGGGNNSAAPASAASAATSVAPTSEKASETPAASSEKQEDVVVETIYEHQYVFNSVGTRFENGEWVDNTTVEESFGNGMCYSAADKTQSEAANEKGTSKNGGPNYQLYINLLKEDNKVEAGRTTMYYGGSLIGKSAFTTTGTWTKADDGTYTINLDAFDYLVQGTGTQANDATTLTTNADGTVVWNYNGCKKVKAEDGTSTIEVNPYSTTLNTQKSFAGEYSGVYFSITDYFNDAPASEEAYDTLEVTALADGSYTVSGCVEDSGISAFTGTITAQGVYEGTCARLDGTQYGYFYTDVDGKVKHFIHMEARERTSYSKGTLITD